jgi:hypothetical protein
MLNSENVEYFKRDALLGVNYFLLKHKQLFSIYNSVENQGIIVVETDLASNQ